MEEEIKEVEKLLIIENELKDFEEILKNAADKILEENVSNYPIFVAHKQQVDLGIPIIDRVKHSTNWSINASTLEDFVNKKVVSSTKVDDFRKTYKNPKTHICVFVLSDIGAQFLFIPRKA